MPTDDLKNGNQRKLGMTVGKRVAYVQPLIHDGVHVIRRTDNPPHLSHRLPPGPIATRVEASMLQQVPRVLGIWRGKSPNMLTDCASDDLVGPVLLRCGDRRGSKIETGVGQILDCSLPGSDRQDDYRSVDRGLDYSAASTATSVSLVNQYEVVAVRDGATKVVYGLLWVHRRTVGVDAPSRPRLTH